MTENSSLRRRAGQGIRGFADLVPKLSAGYSSFELPPRASVLDRFSVTFYSKGRKCTVVDRAKLKRHLIVDYGLSHGTASTICEHRSREQIGRIFEFCSGVIDSLLFSVPELFDGTETRTVHKLVRVLLARLPYGQTPLVKEWKSFGQYLLKRVNSPKEFPDKAERPRGFFSVLFDCASVKRLEHSEQSKECLSKLAHILSSRQFPGGSDDVEREALRVFRLNVSEDYKSDEKFLQQVKLAAGTIAKRIQDTKGDYTFPHISIGNSGSYDSTIKQGGRANDLIEAALPYLNSSPEVDEEIQTPFGVLKCPAGHLRWRNWGRPKEYTMYIKGERNLVSYDDEDFSDDDTPESSPKKFFQKSYDLGDELPTTYLSEKGVVYQGFDYAFGLQIYGAALALREKGGIFMRVSTISEPGNKVRIITITEWWNMILQQPYSHMIRELLSSHPFCESGLTRSNQAWAMLYQAEAKEYPKGTKALFSDLKEATDHIPREIAIAIIEGFCAEYKVPGIEIVLDLIGRERIFYEDGKAVRTRRGVMMGEPMAKAILTLHQLVAEEIAFQRNVILGNTDHKVRMYHVGGDDVAALGPGCYLNDITRNLILMGAKLSPDKHGIYDYVGKYCEKLIKVKNLVRFFRVWDIQKDYSKHPWVESLKIRLLSPTTKSTEVVNDRNTAIGKARSFGKELRYLPDCDFPPKVKKLARDRFIQRMGSFVPEPASYTYWHLLLPTKLGGLDIWLEQDIPELVRNLPGPTKWLIKEILQGSAPQSVQDDFRRLPRNSGFRGFDISEVEVRVPTILDRMGFFSQFKSMTWRDLVQEKGLAKLPETVQSSRLRREGWMTRQEIIDHLLRPIIFGNVLSRKVKQSYYNTTPLKRRYGVLWTLYDFTAEISEIDLRSVFRRPDILVYYDTNVEVPSILEGQYVNMKILDEATRQVANLTLAKPA